MSAATAPAPTAPNLGDDDFDHIVCCDLDVALCGADVSGTEVANPGDFTLDDVCPTCRAAADFRRCGQPCCPGWEW